MDKSKMDWNQLKSKDVQMEEELEMHKKSNKKYLDKVRGESRDAREARDARGAPGVTGQGFGERPVHVLVRAGACLAVTGCRQCRLALTLELDRGAPR